MERLCMKYVDTGAFLALHLKKTSTTPALRMWSRLGRSLTSNHVVDEFATALASRAGCSFSADCVANIYTARTIEFVQSTREDEVEALG